MAAAGANDGAIHLWTRRAPDAPEIVKRPMDSAEALVALGPRDVRVTTTQGKTETLALVRLTPERALVASGTPRKRTEAAATDKPFVKIETIDGKQIWQLDSTKKLYVGPKLVPTAPQPVGPPLQATPDQEDLYLLLGARRLFASVVEMVDQPDKEEAVADARQQALARLEYLKKTGRAPAVADLYADLARAVDDLCRAVADRRTVVAQMKEDARQAGLRRGKEAERALGNRVLGFTMLVMASLPEHRVVGYETHTVYDTEGRHVVEEPVYETYYPLEGFKEPGARLLLNEAIESKVRQAQLKAAAEIADAKTGPALVAALKARNDTVDRIVAHYDTIAGRDFGLEKPAAPPAENKAHGIEATLAWLDAEARRARGRSGRDDPFTLANSILVRSLGPPGNTADALFREAREIVALVPLVPPAAIFDPDRAALCGLAGELVARAVDAETGAYPITESYSEKAAFAVSLMDQALALRPDDPTGKLRQARAIALAQADRVPEGLAQARDLVARKPKSAGARYSLARLECATGHVDRGLDQLEEAVVKLGFRNLTEARARAEFPRNHPRFESLTRIQLKVTGNTGGPLSVTPIHNVVFQNTGPFALYDVVFRVRYQAAEPGKRSRQEVSESSIDTLLPGQSHAVKTESSPVTTVLEPGKGIGKVGRRMAWVNADAVVIAPGQGTLKTPIEGQ
jgi:hypothetical protein